MEGYGIDEAHREKLRNRVLVALAVLCVAGVSGWFIFRDWSEKKRLDEFFTLMRQQNYQAAYELWGCTRETPCRDYSFDRFLEDWGPEGIHNDPDAFEVVKTRHCSTGIIRTLRYRGKEDVHLFVNREDLVMGFSPWPICDPRIKPPE